MKSRIEHLSRLTVLGLALLAFTQCKKADPPTPTKESLPPATQEGKNILGFMLNGKVWNAKIEPYKPAYSELICSYFRGTFSISANRILGDSVNQKVNILSRIGIDKPGTYKLGNIHADKIGAVLYDNARNGLGFHTFDDNSSWLTITRLDTISQPKIISGTFTIDLYDNDDNKLEIRDGRFDVTMY